MVLFNKTSRGVRGHGRNRTTGSTDLLTPEQRLTETILSVGILPTLCILGLMACLMFLHAVWRKRGKGTPNHLPLIIAIFDAIYLLFTLEEKIEYSLTELFRIGGGLDKEVKTFQKRFAKFCLHMGTAIICVHSIEVCHAVLRPMTYCKTWTRKRRFIVAAAVIATGLIYFVSYFAAETIDDERRPTYRSIRNSLEDGLFSILMISTITCCYVIVIVKRFQQILFKSTANNSRKEDPTKRMVRSLILASTVYFLLGVPVDVIKLILIYSQSLDRKSITFWAIKVTQNVMETLYGSVLLCVYILNEVISRKRGYCCPCLMRMSIDEIGAGNGPGIGVKYPAGNGARNGDENSDGNGVRNGAGNGVGSDKGNSAGIGVVDCDGDGSWYGATNDSRSATGDGTWYDDRNGTGNCAGRRTGDGAGSNFF